MNEPTPATVERPARKETPAQKYLRELRVKRYNEALATIPADVPALDLYTYKRYAFVATQNLGKRGLARVVWPWQPRPAVEPIKRGRPRPNNP